MNLKKALKHDVEVAGKTIPTMILVGLFLVGGGSAALLSSFGTVSGEADVTQSIVVNGTPDKTSMGFFGASSGEESDVTAGTVTVDTFTVENNMDRRYSPTFTSYTGVTSVPDEDGQTGTQFTWSEGVRTSFVEYYSEAGPDSVESEYTDSDEDISVSSYEDLQDAVNNPDNKLIQIEGEIELQDKLRISEDSVLFGDGSLDLSGYQIYVDRGTEGIDSDLNLTIEGLDIDNTEIESDERLYADIQVRRLGEVIKSVDLVLRNNNFETPNKVVSTYRDGLGTGKFVFEGNDVSVSESDNWRPALHLDKHEGDVVISDNSFEVKAASSDAVLFGNQIDTATVSHNKFQGVGGIRFSHSEGATPEIQVRQNVFTRLEKAVWVEDMGPHSETNGDLSEISISENLFRENSFDVVNRHSEGDQLSVEGNFFAQGTWEKVNNGNIVGDVSATYEEVGSIPADSTQTVAAVNEFALMLDGSQDYSLTTTIS